MFLSKLKSLLAFYLELVEVFSAYFWTSSIFHIFDPKSLFLFGIFGIFNRLSVKLRYLPAIEPFSAYVRGLQFSYF